MSTPPATPKRSKKRVRFSDPRLETELESASSGLTPFIRRTNLSTTPAPAGHYSAPATLWSRGDNGIPISGTIQFEPLRQVLNSRLKRRLRRRRLSEEANNIEWEKKREVKFLRAEVEQLKGELEAKCIEMQSIRDTEDRGNQEEPGHLVTTNMELSARVQELEQQIVDLKAELQQKEVESEGFEHADSAIASRDLLNLDEDDGRVITNEDLWETQSNDDTISIPTRLDTSFPSPPPTMPNTPCKHLPSRNTRVPASIPNPDSVNKALNNQLQSGFESRREIACANHTPNIAQSSIIRPRREKGDLESYAVGVKKRRQGNMWGKMQILVPFYSPNASGD
jgi:uncharacterized small protein (DUF1192 family)